MRVIKKIYVEITNVCNLACSFCPKTSRIDSYMDIRMFEEILEKIQGRARYLYFHVMGEPLLHPLIGGFMDLAQKYGFRVNLTTNGTLIDEAISIIEKPALRQMNFSLHSAEGKGREYVDSYLDGVFRLIRMSKKDRGKLICLRLWNHDLEKAGKNNEQMLDRIRLEFPSGINISDKPTKVNGVKLAENVFLNQSEKFDWPDAGKSELGGAGYCNCLKYQAAILVDGTVVPCCLDNNGVMKLGNIKTESFDSIIESKRARAIYDGFNRKEISEEMCRKCGFRQRFG
jgi:radical SAM protein with 4Fe4S-binding SPASM domain